MKRCKEERNGLCRLGSRPTAARGTSLKIRHDLGSRLVQIGDRIKDCRVTAVEHRQLRDSPPHDAGAGDPDLHR